MKLYALRDRLIDYFLQPFAAPGDKEVLSSLASIINREGNHDPIAQAPHHFELWKLADINTDTGRVTGNPEFLADCNSLLRGDLRKSAGPGNREIPSAGRHSASPAGGPTGPTHAEERAPTGTPQAENRLGAPPDPKPDGTGEQPGDEISRSHGNY